MEKINLLEASDIHTSDPELVDVSTIHELELGQHTLFILDNQSIDILDLSGEAPYLADNGVHLDREETYRLFISLKEVFK